MFEPDETSHVQGFLDPCYFLTCLSLIPFNVKRMKQDPVFHSSDDVFTFFLQATSHCEEEDRLERSKEADIHKALNSINAVSTQEDF